MKTFLCILVLLGGALATVSAADLSPFKTADDLWGYILKMRQDGPAGKPRTEEERQAIVKQFIADVNSALLEFGRRYPADARRWEAKLLQIQAASALANIENKPIDEAADEKSFKEIVAAPSAPPDVKNKANLYLVQIHIGRLRQSANAAALAAVEAEMAAFEKDYPQDPHKEQLRLLMARSYQKLDPVKAESLLRTLARSADPSIVGQAQGLLVALDIGKKPLQLKFTAVDGSTVDVEKLRGKVVLLDFWATWCGPCVVSLPDLLATYGKLHGKGFEIVGISLDQDKNKLIAFTKQRGMTWPQYFDGKGWQNEIGTRFGVSAIPALWIVDKKGFARQIERDVLSSEAARLLSE